MWISFSTDLVYDKDHVINSAPGSLRGYPFKYSDMAGKCTTTNMCIYYNIVSIWLNLNCESICCFVFFGEVSCAKFPTHLSFLNCSANTNIALLKITLLLTFLSKCTRPPRELRWGRKVFDTETLGDKCQKRGRDQLNIACRRDFLVRLALWTEQMAKSRQIPTN